MHKLPPSDYPRARPLFHQLVSTHVGINGVLSGNNPGVVYVDDLATPQIALLINPEGACLGGAEPTPARITALKALIARLLDDPDFEALWIACDPAWEDRLADILPRPPLDQPRQHYVCTALAHDWRARVPDGFAVEPITADLLNRPNLDIPEHIHHWMNGNWGSTEAFLARAFGVVTIDQAQQRVVSWSLCDCTGGAACEIGIHTHPDYRRRGLAALTTAAAVDHALTHGYESVGWHCHTENTGSQRTALKVGFVLEREYVHHISFRSAAVHLAEDARMHAVREDFIGAAECYIHATRASDQPEWGHYIPFYAACMFVKAGAEYYGAAWEWLHYAVAHGFDDANTLQNSPALEPLKSAPGWAALLAELGG